MCSLVRLVLAAYAPELRNWDREAPLERDTAAPGVNSQVVVATRALKVEVAVANGSVTVQLLQFDSTTVTSPEQDTIQK